MKKIISILILAITISMAQNAVAQEPTAKADSIEEQRTFLQVDYEQLKTLAADTKKFNSQLKRFINADTTLTQEEIRDIYYGYIFTNQYAPFSDKCIECDKALNKNDLKLALKKYEAKLKETPVCGHLLLRACMLSDTLRGKDDKQTLNLLWRTRALAQLILNTGDGKHLDTGIKVNWVDDEYFILTLFGFNKLQDQSIARTTSAIGDRMEVIIDGETQVFYFDLTQYFEKLNKMFK